MTVSKMTILACLAASAAVSAAAGEHVTPPEVPANLEVPAGHKPFRMWHATGTQNYICLAAGQAWTFIGPQATLFDDDNDQTLTHFLSPNPVEGGVARATWQHSKDTSARMTGRAPKYWRRVTSVPASSANGASRGIAPSSF